MAYVYLWGDMVSKLKISLIIILVLGLAVLGFYYAKSLPTRYAVFAGYNTHGKISPYVISYLKGLNEVCDGVVYIADSPLLKKERQKLKGLVMYTAHKRHKEYDFGSYKRGFKWLKDNGYLEKADELIFANDSTYAPMTSFKPMFKKMALRPELDFWSNTQNSRFTQHLQTYFIVFRKRVINSKAFAIFLNDVKHQQDSSLYITEYEIKLTPLLDSLGYKWDSYIPYDEFKDFELPDNNSYPLTLLSKYHNQFLKRRTFTKDLDVREDKEQVLEYVKKNYPARYKEIIDDINNPNKRMKHVRLFKAKH